ncbi:MAG TPA: DUF1080 domain-containing protein [Armatimonadota bacterium]|jgi:hypothetical protein
MLLRRLVLILTALAALGSLCAASAAPKAKGVLGRWDLTVGTGEGAAPSWLEVTESAPGVLQARFCGAFGSAFKVADISSEGKTLRFSLNGPFAEKKNESWQATLKGKTLTGVTWGERGGETPWTGKRPPIFKKPKRVKWGEPINLLNGTDLTGWHLRHPSGKQSWTVINGVMTCNNPGNDIVTDREFKDFKVHVEYRYPKESNSGLYLRGRYEVQINDDSGAAPESHGSGGVYGLITPRVNAAKPAGEWQSLDVTLVGNWVTIVANGQTLCEDEEIAGVTGGALNSDEGAPGPFFLQGDHGPVEIRAFVVTPRA